MRGWGKVDEEKREKRAPQPAQKKRKQSWNGSNAGVWWKDGNKEKRPDQGRRGVYTP